MPSSHEIGGLKGSEEYVMFFPGFPSVCIIALLGGSWDLVSTVISTLTGVISTYKYSYLNCNPSN